MDNNIIINGNLESDSAPETRSETKYYPLFYEEIPKEFWLVAERELNETEEKRNKCLKKLKEFVKHEDLLIEDHDILAAVRNQKFNMKKTEAKLKKLSDVKRKMLKELTEMDMEKIETIIDDMGFGILPFRDENGSIIVYSRPEGFQFEKYSVREVAAVLMGVGIMIWKNPLTTITGIVYLAECKTNSMNVIYEIMKEVKRSLSIVGAFPLRIPRVEILNSYPIIRWFGRIIFPLISKKIVERFYFHDKGYEGLHELYDPKLLPEEFDGLAGPRSNAHYRQRLLDIIKDLRNRNY